jgi:SAM-dependent methyltransferase
MDALGYIDCGDNRDTVLFPWVREIVLQRKPGSVLDFGCGDARFSVELARHVKGRVSAYDRDPHMREQARRRIAGEGNAAVSLCEEPGAGWTGVFDVVVMLGVWMCWRTHAECGENLALIARSLKPGGVLVASVTHPCFRNRTFATYRTDFDEDRYMANGTPFRVYVGTAGKEIVIEDFHWNLEAMITQVREAGLVLDILKEHADGPNGEAPSWLSLVLSKPACEPTGE